MSWWRKGLPGNVGSEEEGQEGTARGTPVAHFNQGRYSQVALYITGALRSLNHIQGDPASSTT
jgi:hypothetical protein